MKKVLTLMMVAGMFSLVACGPSAKDKEAAEAKAEQVANDLMKGMDEATTKDEAKEDETAEVADTDKEATTEDAAATEDAPADADATPKEEAPAE